MDLSFIKKVEKVTSFDLSIRDFQTLKYKSEIQYLFNKHFFAGINIDKIPNGIDVTSINRLIAELKRISKSQFLKLHSYNLKGIGPGEATLFFLCNNSVLGGGSSSGVDVIVGSSKYEVKGVRVSSRGVMSDFKLGGTVSLYTIQKQLNDLRIKLGLPGSSTEIKGSVIYKMRELSPNEFDVIEAEYSKAAYNYFKGHEVIFINNTKSSPKLGEIESIRSIGINEILIERMTSGTIKPKIMP